MRRRRSSLQDAVLPAVLQDLIDEGGLDDRRLRGKSVDQGGVAQDVDASGNPLGHVRNPGDRIGREEILLAACHLQAMAYVLRNFTGAKGRDEEFDADTLGELVQVWPLQQALQL